MYYSSKEEEEEEKDVGVLENITGGHFHSDVRASRGLLFLRGEENAIRTGSSWTEQMYTVYSGIHLITKRQQTVPKNDKKTFTTQENKKRRIKRRVVTCSTGSRPFSINENEAKETITSYLTVDQNADSLPMNKREIFQQQQKSQLFFSCCCFGPRLKPFVISPLDDHHRRLQPNGQQIRYREKKRASTLSVFFVLSYFSRICEM